MLRRQKKHGQSLVEFTALILFILIAFVVFQKYIVRGFSGRWKGIGDTFGQGRIYDPQKTIACAFDPQYTHRWFNQDCYEEFCEDDCLRITMTDADCTACIVSCQTPYCDDP